MTGDLSKFIAQHRPQVEEALAKYLPVSSRPCTAEFNDAVRYAVFPGGKRWRPMLTLLGALAVGGGVEESLPAAAAVEFLHTSSLVLDDLPAMDDAELRRARATLHIAFGEGTALLAALALLNQSYALFIEACRRSGAPEALARLIAEAVECVGADGMIGGQVADLESRHSVRGLVGLESRSLKTTALTRLMMVAGAVVAGASDAQLAALSKYGECFGMAYQICDDLLDELGRSDLTGKPARQDQRHLRPSFVAEFGSEGAYRMVLDLLDDAKEAVRAQFFRRHEAALLADATELITQDIKRVGADGELVHSESLGAGGEGLWPVACNL